MPSLWQTYGPRGYVWANVVLRSVLGHLGLERDSSPRGGGSGVDMSFMPIHNTTPMLQSTLSSATSGTDPKQTVLPHHPITCSGDLFVDLDVRGFSCEHVSVNMDTDSRTKSVLNHSMVLLVLEPAISNGDWQYKTPDELIEDWDKRHPEEPWN